MKRVTILLASAALAVGATAAVAAAQPLPQSDTVDASIPTQLPRTAVPSHYAISIAPDAEALTFDGKVRIDLRVVQPTRELVVNAADLAIASASLTGADGKSLTAEVRLDADAQTATFAFDRLLAPGRYALDIAYSGKINTQANGLFALDYTNVDGGDARALFTQFQAPDARRFVPSWDEPDYKATFDLAARIPAGWMGVSNMPVASSREVGGGLKEVRFATSPVMSTYLLFFGAGDFERIARKVGDAEVGIVATRGNVEKGRFALDAEAQILPYFNDYFGTPYPLPKLDNIAGPGQSQFFGAMENWGAIFTFERILLLDPSITSEYERQAIFEVEAHEMAHQWFGNLVTMAWWDDLWLNEGFASWMANRTTQHFHPEWGADIEQVAAREAAMALDSFDSTHPVVQSVRTVEQVNQAFDAITYSKGESVISMLEGFAGEAVWKAGIRDYMKRHAYQNTRTSDLWAAMERAGATGLIRIAQDFTTQPGIPLISVGPARCVDGRTVATLTQGQFSKDRRAEVAANPLRWNVPVRASIAAGETVRVITAGPTTLLSAPGCGTLLINSGQTGYYRTLYQPRQAQALQASFARLGAVDQYGLLADSMALSESGYQPMATGLDFLAAVSPQANPRVVMQAVGKWSGLYDDLDGQAAAQAAIADRVRQAYGPLMAELGFAPRAGESPMVSLLRPALIATLGKFEDPAVTAEAARLFRAWQGDPDAIPGSLKESWLAVVARNADAATWDALHAKARATTGAVERTSLYELLARTRDEALAQRALELALTDEPGKTVSAGMISAVAALHPRLAVDFALAHLPQVDKFIDLSSRSRFMQRLARASDDPAMIPILEAYARDNLGESDRRPIEQAIERIRWNAASQPRIEAETAAWLAAHPL